MKPLKLIAALIVLIPASTMAYTADTTSKHWFYDAQAHIESMLVGSTKMSYEKAIFEIENAWHEDTLDYAAYSSMIDYHTDVIRSILKAYPQKTDFTHDLLKTAYQKQVAYQKVITNYAIFSYMTDTVYSIQDGGFKFLIHQKPFSYLSDDPLGTNDWSHTQIVNLLETGKGNCFSLASLYKILADRLQSDAFLCTAPGHIYIRHADDNGTLFNVELAGRAFPGTGTIETLTYTSNEATKSGIALRELTTKQVVALCLVYLAKGYEYKFKTADDDFLLSCANMALQYDDHSLHAMLLKAQVLERKLTSTHKSISQLQPTKEFQEYQKWVTKIYSLGYSEMPFEMKNVLIKHWMKDTTFMLSSKDNAPKHALYSSVSPTRYASLSWGAFDEEMQKKRVERYGNTVFDTKTKQVIAFLQSDVLFHQYNFDPVAFALNIDPLAHKLPAASPYAFCLNSPIAFNDPDGAYPKLRITNQVSGYTAIKVYGKTNINVIVPTYSAVLYDVRKGKATPMGTYNVTRDGWYNIGSKKGEIKYEDRSFEPKKDRTYTAVKFDYVAGTPALALRQGGSQNLDATPLNNHTYTDGTPLPKSINRADPNVATGVMIHIGGAYEHEDGSVSLGGTYGCMGVVSPDNVYKSEAELNAAMKNGKYMNNTSNATMKDLSKKMDEANRKDPGKDKIEVDVDKRKK